MAKHIIIFIIVIFVAAGGYWGYLQIKETKPLEEIQTETPENQVQKITLPEEEQMFESAREYIKQYSVEGMEVELTIIKKIDNWALLEAVPINVETDPVGVILEKVDGQWKTHTFGTILPGWEEKVPELFK